MMPNWNSASDVYGSNCSSFYGAQENYYHPSKNYQSYGGFPQTGVYNDLPVANNTGFHCQPPTPGAYQQPAMMPTAPSPVYNHHQPPPPPAMNTAYMERPYPLPNHPPCQGPPGGPWNYGYCYGFYGEAPCAYVDVIDMEDFM